MSKTLVFAVDFDGCLVEFDFPKIGEQTEKQKELMKILKRLQKKGTSHTKERKNIISETI